MNKYIKPELVQSVADFLAGKPVGTSSLEVAQHLGVGRKRASNILCEGREQGLLFWVCAKRGCKQHGLWAARSNLAATQKRVDEIAAEQTAMAKRNHCLRQREYNARRKYGDDVPEKPIIQRIVPAASAPRLKVKAPASVWQLGAMA